MPMNAAIFLIVYFLPTLICFYRACLPRGRRLTSPETLIFFNLFLGWTGIVWFLCLVYALSGGRDQQRRREVAKLRDAENLRREAFGEPLLP